MSTSSERAVERAIGAMHDNLGEQVAIDDLARSAMFSKFHFSRMFRHIAGISPGRFLSALRIQEAKHQLLATSFNVADISVLVGYNSIGTFSTRFARSVGLAPSVFRRLDGFAPRIPTEVPAAPGAAVVRGRIHSFRPGGQSGPVFLGLFPDRIPEGRPARCAIIEEPGAYRLDDVPPGTWYLLCRATTGDPRRSDPDSNLVGTIGPITVAADATTTVNVCLEPMRAWDPPLLLALPDTRMIYRSMLTEERLAAQPARVGPAAA